MMPPDIKTVTPKNALDIILDHSAFIKNIATKNPSVESPIEDDTNGFGFLIRQLKAPENFRPVCSLPESVDRTRYYDASLGSWKKRENLLIRGRAKPGKGFTKKTSVSLLPPNGKMTLFSQQHGIALLFDSGKCQLKPAYIFDENVTSNNRWWLYGAKNGNSRPGGHSLPAATTLAQIKKSHETHIKKNSVPEWNEILCGLSTDAVIGVVIPQDDLLSRLNGKYRQLILLKELTIDVPLFIITSAQGIQLYRRAMFEDDLKLAEQSADGSLEKDFFTQINLLKKELGGLIKRFDLDSLDSVVSQLNEKIALRDWQGMLSILIDARFFDIGSEVSLESVLEKIDIGALSHALFKSIQEGDFAGVNGFYCLSVALENTAYENNTESFKTIGSLLTALIEKADAGTLASGLAAKVTQGAFAGKNGFYCLCAALHHAAVSNNPKSVKTTVSLLTALIEKADAGTLASGLAAKVMQGDFAGQNGFYFLSIALHDATAKNNTESVKTIGSLLIALIEKAEAGALASGLAQEATQGASAGQNGFYCLSLALHNAAAKNNTESVKTIGSLLTALIKKAAAGTLASGFTQEATQGASAGQNGFYCLSGALHYAVFRNNTESVKTIGSLLTALIEKAEAGTLASGLAAKATQGDSAGKNGVYWLRIALENATFLNNTESVKTIGSLLTALIKKAGAGALASGFTQEATQGDSAGQNGVYLLSTALHYAVFLNNTESIKTIGGLLTALIGKTDAGALASGFAAKATQGDSAGENGFYVLSAALRYVAYENNTESVKTIGNLLTALIEKAEAETLASGFAAKATQGDSAGQNGFYCLSVALYNAANKNRTENVKIIGSLLTALIEKIEAGTLASGLAAAKVTQGAFAGKNGFYWLTFLLNENSKLLFKGNDDALTHLLFRLLIKLNDVEIPDDLFSIALSYKGKIVPMLMKYLAEMKDVTAINTFMDPQKNLGRYIDFHRNQGRFFDTTKKTNTRQQVIKYCEKLTTYQTNNMQPNS